MSERIQKNIILSNRWKKYCSQYRDSIRQVAGRAGIDHTQLVRAINSGVGSDNIRSSLRAIGLPEELIPLPTCAKTLVGIIYRQQDQLSRCQKM